MKFIFDPSLALYLPLGELDGATLMSKDSHGHPCSVSGAIWAWPGRNFDGVDDYVDAGNPLALQFTGDFTLETWLKTSVVARQAALSKIDSNWATDGAWQLGVNTSGYGEFIPGSLTQYIYGNTLVADGHWHHLVGIRTGSDFFLYLDGNQDGSNTAGDIDVKTTATVRIGRRYASGALHFSGAIGEVRVYSRALTPAEMARNYLATKWRYR